MSVSYLVVRKRLANRKSSQQNQLTSQDLLTDLFCRLKLGLEAQKHWRGLQGFELIPKVVTGVRFVDGEETNPTGRLINDLNKDAPVSDTQHLTISLVRNCGGCNAKLNIPPLSVRVCLELIVDVDEFATRIRSWRSQI
jgi:hypothetical protein